MGFEIMRDEVRRLLARLHATLDDGGDAVALARAHERLIRQARSLVGDRRLGDGERDELAALVDGVARLRAIADAAAGSGARAAA
jgi:hypothetical protein